MYLMKEKLQQLRSVAAVQGSKELHMAAYMIESKIENGKRWQSLEIEPEIPRCSATEL